MAYREIKEVHEITDVHGNSMTETSTTIESVIKREEPDYIKIYTRMWCEFNGIPEKWRPLFLALACRMSYASAGDGGDGGQIVCTMGPFGKDIMRECGWKTTDPLYRGLKALTDHHAIRKIGRGVYQINPEYAGRGGWNYNKKDRQGGIKNLIATFDFKKKSVSTQIILHDDFGA